MDKQQPGHPSIQHEHYHKTFVHLDNTLTTLDSGFRYGGNV